MVMRSVHTINNMTGMDNLLRNRVCQLQYNYRQKSLFLSENDTKIIRTLPYSPVQSDNVQIKRVHRKIS